MDFLKRLFGQKPAANQANAEDRARSQRLAGQETGQSADEQAGTRSRMEAEMDAQRRAREQPPAPDA
jgi:hypothetical protein